MSHLSTSSLATVLTFALATSALAQTPEPAASVSAIFAADRAAMGPATQGAIAGEYAFAGMGLNGKVTSISDIATGRYVDTMAAGPLSETDAFDGQHAWTREPSGTVTVQDGGEQRALAVNEAYRRANLWWRADRGGANIEGLGVKRDAAGAAYDVVAVTPTGGKRFEAWFSAGDHLLSRIIEQNGARAITTTYSNYSLAGGRMVPGKMVMDDGEGAKYLQTLTLISARAEPTPPAPAFAAPTDKIADVAIAGGAASTQMPFTLINNHIYGEATINGTGPYRFIFDTGGHNLVTPAMAKTIGLKTSGAMDGGGAGEGVVDVAFTKVGELKIAGATMKDQAFVVLPLDALSDIEGIEEQGMIGFETFRRFVTRIDYGGHTVTLIDPKTFDPRDAGTPIHFDFADSNPEIAGSFEGIPGKFRIDTGSRADLTINKPFAERNDLRAKHPKGMDMVDGWGIGGPSRAYVTRGASLMLGPVEVRGVVASLATQKKGAFAGDDSQGNIGAGVLKRFVVTFDYGHQLMYLKPLPGTVADVSQFDRAGMWFNRAPDGFKVADVTTGGPAEAAGVQVGDHIVSVEGKPASGIAVADLRRRLRNDAPGQTVNLGLSRGGKTSVVTVTLRDLI